MPTIAIVDGVVVVIYPNDHDPPHIHASYGEYECKMTIVGAKLMGGELPKSKLKLLRRWLVLHHKEVSFAWDEIYSGRGYKGRIT